MKYNKKILEAINKGIKLVLDVFVYDSESIMQKIILSEMTT